MRTSGKRPPLEEGNDELILSHSNYFQNQNTPLRTSMMNKEQSKKSLKNVCSDPVFDPSPFPHGDPKQQQLAGRKMPASPGGVHPLPLNAHAQSHSAEGVRTLSRLGIKEGAYYLSPRQVPHSLLNYGSCLRSDAYLRQALTSPYTRRKKDALFSSSGDGTNNMMAASPYVANGSTTGFLKKGDGTSHVMYRETSGHEIFKTPIRREETIQQKYRPNHEMSPPLSMSSDSSSRSRHYSHNPFEIGSDRLHFPVFSPGVLHTASTPSSTEGGSFRWNIEHLAELRPVHIDEKDIKRQLARYSHMHSPDSDLEERAQKAIDYYFTNHMVVPSPWAEPPPPHVLPATPVYASEYLMSTPDEIYGASKKDLWRNKKTQEWKDCASQTALTLPVDFDIQSVFGDHMTYQEQEKSNSDGMSTSSLRRKLFFNADTSSVLSPVRAGVESPDHLAAALRSPSPHNLLEKGTPEWEPASPVHTPSSVQFSSSPIRGLFGDDRVYHMTSFSESRNLASPELSPIPLKKSGKDKVIKLFSMVESDNAGHSDEEGFGLGVKKFLPMERCEGSSPKPSLQSPDMSPIALSGTDGSTLLKTRSVAGDGSLSSSAKTLQWSPKHSPTVPQPFSDYITNYTAQRIKVPMEADIFSGGCQRDQGHSMKEMSVTDAGDVDGASSVDVFQHRSTSSNVDAGYYTASGSGSLQLTQQETGLQASSAGNGLSDASNLFSSLESKLQYRDSKSGVQSLNTSSTGDGLTQDSGVSSVAGLEGGGLYTNLTSQFMSIPLRSETSIDGCELDASMRSVGNGRPPHFEFQGLKDEQRDFRVLKWDTDIFKGSDCKEEPTAEGRVKRENIGANHSEQKVRRQDDIKFVTVDKGLHEKHVRFLEQVADTLQKEVPENQENFVVAKSRNHCAAHGLTDSTTRHNNTEDFFGRDSDDDVLNRARKYLALMNSGASAESMGSDLPEESSHEKEETMKSVIAVQMPTKPLGSSSTPSKRIMGQLARDLLSPCVGEHGSPTLASQVAMEIIRRAEEELKQCQNICLPDS